MKLKLTFLTLLFSTIVFANREYTTVKSKHEIKIDGFLNPEEWQDIPSTSDFIQINPVEKGKASFQTEVKVTYDDNFIYVGAMMFDNHPDSILAQLGDRDENPNADQFRVVFDPYNQRTDGYNFTVFASGVQQDSRFQDWTYNGVWHSAVQILDNGWSVEMKIPYSALRFPNKPVQVWGLQFTREIRRYREGDQWAYVPKGDENFMRHWGELKGIENIDPPVRLSLTPYISAIADHYPASDNFNDNLSKGWSAGMDLKYGLNDSYTLDMTLLPDFSQVRSDNLVKNLGAFEVRYDETRPFFQEGTELFNNGDLFYSRRIGGAPVNQYDVYNELQEGEEIVYNPSTTNLLNASKVSGRSDNGLGIGVFNAVTSSSYAIVQDSLGNERHIETNPLVNYNITTFDQNLGNNNTMYLINTSVWRAGSTYDANVAANGGEFFFFKNNYTAEYQATISKLSNEEDYGYSYWLGAGKATGKFKFWADYEEISTNFNNNDMGLTFETGKQEVTGNFSYQEFNPFWILNWANIATDYVVTKRIDEASINRIWLGGRAMGLHTKSWTFFWGGANITPKSYLDYFEARSPGRVFIRERGKGAGINISSDYRKKFALDLGFNTSTQEYDIPSRWAWYSISPRYRFSDKFNVIYSVDINQDKNQIGFSTFDGDSPIFGRRDVWSTTNTLNAKYLFMNNVSLSLQARHYRSKGIYKQYLNLEDDGTVSDNPNNYDQDFNFNFFYVNLVFNYQFAPGSNLILVYKNQIIGEDQNTAFNFTQNFDSMGNLPQQNTFSIKLLYYFDYLYIKNLKKKNA